MDGMTDFARTEEDGQPSFRPERSEALRIAGTYAVFGVIWILLSDRVMALISTNNEMLERISVIKGWFYVILTAVMLFALVWRSLQRATIDARRLAEALASQQALNGELKTTNDALEAARVENEEAHRRLVAANAAQEALNRELEISCTRLEEAHAKLERSNRDLEETNCMLEEEIAGHLGAEAALQMARDEALQASEAKSRFLANMSHEVRTPLNGIIGMTELLMMEMPEGRQREHLGLVKRSADSLLAIINDILDYSRIEEGRMQLDDASFQPKHLVSDVVGLFRATARAKNLALIEEIDSRVPDAVIGDALRIRQIVSNLVGNAIKFTAEGHVRVELTAAAAAEPASQPSGPERTALSFGKPDAPAGIRNGPTVYLRLKVEDTGVGIAPDKQHLLFERFSQVDSSYSKQHQGTGLGLAITRRLVELLHGRIWLESEPGRGSTFRIELPLPLDATRPASQDIHPQPATVP